MKSFNYKCIKFCSSMKVSLLYISIILFHLQMIISLTALSAVIQEVVSVTVSTTRHSNVIIVYNIILLYNGLIYIYSFLWFQCWLSLFQLPCSEYTNTHAQLNSTWLDRWIHLRKWHPIRDPLIVVVETLFFHSIWRYHFNA